MVLDPIPQSLPVHFFGSRPQPPTSRHSAIEGRPAIHLKSHVLESRLIYFAKETQIFAQETQTLQTRVEHAHSAIRCSGSSCIVFGNICIETRPMRIQKVVHSSHVSSTVQKRPRFCKRGLNSMYTGEGRPAIYRESRELESCLIYFAEQTQILQKRPRFYVYWRRSSCNIYLESRALQLESSLMYFANETQILQKRLRLCKRDLDSTCVGEGRPFRVMRHMRIGNTQNAIQQPYSIVINIFATYIGCLTVAIQYFTVWH